MLVRLFTHRSLALFDGRPFVYSVLYRCTSSPTCQASYSTSRRASTFHTVRYRQVPVSPQKTKVSFASKAFQISVVCTIVEVYYDTSKYGTCSRLLLVYNCNGYSSRNSSQTEVLVSCCSYYQLRQLLASGLAWHLLRLEQQKYAKKKDMRLVKAQGQGPVKRFVTTQTNNVHFQFVSYTNNKLDLVDGGTAEFLIEEERSIRSLAVRRPELKIQILETQLIFFSTSFVRNGRANPQVQHFSGQSGRSDLLICMCSALPGGRP